MLTEIETSTGPVTMFATRSEAARYAARLQADGCEVSVYKRTIRLGGRHDFVMWFVG